MLNTGSRVFVLSEKDEVRDVVNLSGGYWQAPRDEFGNGAGRQQWPKFTSAIVAFAMRSFLERLS